MIAGSLATALPWIEGLVALYLLIGLFLRPMSLAATALALVPGGAPTLDPAHAAATPLIGCLLDGPSQPLMALSAALSGSATVDGVCALIAVALTSLIYWGDRRALSVDGFLYRPIAPDWPDDDDASPSLALLSPISSHYWDDDGA